MRCVLVSAAESAGEPAATAAGAPVTESPADTAASTALEAAAGRTEPAPADTDAGTPDSDGVEILDIPVKKSPRNRRPVSKQVTDQLLDSVLDSLPEPKQPGQGRSRSRRVTTAGGPTATVQPIVVPGHDNP